MNKLYYFHENKDDKRQGFGSDIQVRENWDVFSSMATYGAETLAGQAACFPYPENQKQF
jgi:hypothetical protein